MPRMAAEKSLEELLLERQGQISSRIRENNLDEALGMIDRLCAAFKLPRSEYDRSGCTPYSNEVARMYEMDYINASFVPACDRMFIAAQEPRNEQRDLFIDLLLRSETRLVVCLNNDESRYFEEEWLQSREVVQHMGRDLFVDEIYRIRGSEIRRLRYINWSDFSVVSRQEMDFFHSYFDAIHADPILIHCFAGVGRTGTFIMYHILKKTKNLTLDLFVGILIRLRSKRAHLVTNKIQLEFLRSIFLRD